MVAVLATIGWGWAAWPYTVDDAYIVARVGRTLVEHGTWGINPAMPVDAVTSLPWGLLAASAVAFGLDPMAVAKVVGIACAALAAWICVRSVARRARGRTAAWLAAMLVSGQHLNGLSAAAGLETGLATLLVTGSATEAARARPRAMLVGLLAGALAWVRPEATAAGLAALAALALRRRLTVASVAVAGGAILGVAALRLLAFGDPWPLAAHAKPPDPSHAVAYLASGLVLSGAIALLPAAIPALRRRDRRPWGLALPSVAGLGAILVAGGDWMPTYRMIAPVLPPLAALAALGLARPWPEMRQSRSALPRMARRIAVVALPLTAVALPGLDAWNEVPEMRRAGLLASQRGPLLAERIATHGRRVALVDVGIVGWHRPELDIIDLGGLTEPSVARAAGGYLDKRIDPGWLAARGPDVIVVHSRTRPWVDRETGRIRIRGHPVEHRVLGLPWVTRNFLPRELFEYRRGYWYLVMAIASERTHARAIAP